MIKKIILLPMIISPILLSVACSKSEMENKNNTNKFFDFHGIKIKNEKNYYNKRNKNHPSYNLNYKQGYILGSINIRMYSKPGTKNIYPLTVSEFDELIQKIENELSYGPEIFNLKMIKIGNYYTNDGASATYDSQSQIIDIYDGDFYDYTTNNSIGKERIFEEIMLSLQHEYGHYISSEILQNEKKYSFDSQGLYTGEGVVENAGNDEAGPSIDIGDAAGKEKIYASTINKKFIKEFKNILKYNDINDSIEKKTLRTWEENSITKNAVSNVYNVAQIWNEFIKKGPITAGFLKPNYYYGIGKNINGESAEPMDIKDYVQRGYDELFAKRFTTMFKPGNDPYFEMYQTLQNVDDNDNIQFFKDYIYEKNEKNMLKENRRSWKFFNLIGKSLGYTGNKNLAIIKRLNNRTYINEKALDFEIAKEKKNIVEKIMKLIETNVVSIDQIPSWVISILKSSYNSEINNNKARIGGYLNQTQFEQLGLSKINDFKNGVKMILKIEDGNSIPIRIFKTNYKYKKQYNSKINDYLELSNSQGKYFWVTNNGDNKAFVINDENFNEKGAWDENDFVDLDLIINKKLIIKNGSKKFILKSVRNGNDKISNIDIAKTWTYIPDQENDQKGNFKTYIGYEENYSSNKIAKIKEYKFF